MRLLPKRARQLLTGAVAFVCVGPPAHADAQIFVWEAMQAEANPPGYLSLEQQCLRSVSRSGWTSAECSTLRLMAEQGQCKRTLVPDKTMYDSMTGPRQSVKGSTEKRLGNKTAAYVCTIPAGKSAHWYTGYAGACNNLGINPRLSTPILQQSTETIVQQPPFTFYQEGMRVCGPCGIKIPDVSIVIPGGVEHHYEYSFPE